MKKFILLFLLLTLTGCKTFDGKFIALHSLDSVEIGLFPVKDGATRNVVIESLGPPLRKEVSRLPEGPFFGPQEGLESVVKPNSLYEEWLYRESGYDYYVWFSTISRQSRSERVVVAVAKYTTGAVF